MLHIDRIHSKGVRLGAVHSSSMSACLFDTQSGSTCYRTIACYMYHEGSEKRLKELWWFKEASLDIALNFQNCTIYHA